MADRTSQVMDRSQSHVVRANGPQPVALKRKMLESYRRVVGDEAIEEIRELARELRGLRVLELSSTARAQRWIWRCHIDSSTPDPAVWQRLRPYVERHDRAVFTLPAFVPADLGASVSMIAPAIDPLSSKNRDLPGYLARETVAELGIDLARPAAFMAATLRLAIGRGIRAQPDRSCGKPLTDLFASSDRQAL